MRPIDQNAMDAILRYVNDYYRENHTSPTIRQISEATGVSKSKTQRCVVDMKERGIFEYNRGISSAPKSAKVKTSYISAPVVGSIQCGSPEQEEEMVEEYVSLPVSIFGKGDYYILRAKGDSMVDAGIEEDDLIVVERNCDVAFLSNGKRPLRVVRDGKRVEVIFPKNTVVLDKVLLNEKESSRRRFTLGHEGAHSIIAKQNPMQDVGCFHNTFDPERQYTLEERRELLSFSEAQADRLSSVFLMPRFILEKVMKKYKCENGIPVYGWNVFAPEDKITLRKMADCMGVSHQALVIRLKTLKLLIPHDLTEYLEKGLQLGGAQ